MHVVDTSSVLASIGAAARRARHTCMSHDIFLMELIMIH
jgi:hypothetical protein